MVAPKVAQETSHGAKEEADVVLLYGVRRSTTVKVLAIAGGRGATGALAQLGIRPGETLNVRRTAPLGGPILVEGPGGTVAIGRGLARKVKVRVLS